jgi:uncharacterized protein DUF397
MVRTRWRKSSFTQEANCVELAFGAGVRDSKNPTGGHLPLNTLAYQALLKFARRN